MIYSGRSGQGIARSVRVPHWALKDAKAQELLTAYNEAQRREREASARAHHAKEVAMDAYAELYAHYLRASWSGVCDRVKHIPARPTP